MPNSYDADLWHNNHFVGRFRASGNDEADAKSVKKILSEKGLTSSSSDFQKVSAQARRFYEASEVLYASGGAELTVPYIVNGCFCAELCLKALHTIHGRCPTGHELAKLYEKLRPEVKDLIQRAYEVNAQADPRAGRTEFTEAIQTLSGCFIEWRYLNEKAETGVVSPPFLRLVVSALWQALESHG